MGNAGDKRKIKPPHGPMTKKSKPTMTQQKQKDNASVCVVCTHEDHRVLVLCDGCPNAFHLKCLSPPLHRVPRQPQWFCADCQATPLPTQPQDEDINNGKDTEIFEPPVKRQRKAPPKAIGSPWEQAFTHQAPGSTKARKMDLEEPPMRNAPTKEGATRRSTRKRVNQSETNDTNDQIDDFDSDTTPLAKLSAAQHQPVKPKDSKAPKTQTQSDPKGKKALRRSKRNAPTQKAPSGENRKEEDDDDDDDGEDNDGVASEDTSMNKTRSRAGKRPLRKAASGLKVATTPLDVDGDSSEFVMETSEESEGDSWESSSSSSASDDFVKGKPRLARMPRPAQLKRSSNQRRQNQNPKPRARRPSPTASSRTTSPANSTSSQVDGGDSLDIDPGEEGDDDLVEEEYTGPRYFVEYASSNSRCKSCDESIPKNSLRVGVRIRHSMFGMSTYYKHLECSQLCLISSLLPDQEHLTGLRLLEPTDASRVMDLLQANTNAKINDERNELASTDYQLKKRMQEKEPSSKLTATLLPYQREALHWMTNQEKSVYKGGILADEMGMGKTLQTIACILENVRSCPPNSSPGTGPKRGGTLVICPVVAVTQWRHEIEKFVQQNTLTVYVHHGPKRMDLASRIAAYDVVLTTYSIAEYEARQRLGWQKVACQYCNRKFLPEKLPFHHKYFCGPDAVRTKRQQKQKQKRQKQRQTQKKKLKSIHDNSSSSSASESSGESETEVKPPPSKQAKTSSSNNKKNAKSPLHDIEWTRIVLDEAHYIKDRNCNTARSVFALKSQFKWCLTGTPLQNRIGELFSLVRFLQVPDYAYYHCRLCSCQSIDYKMKCEQCPHGTGKHYSFFLKKIVQPIQGYGYVGEGKIAMLRLQNDVLQHILLRRTKEGRADDICLPPKLVRIRKDALDEREQDFYQAIYTESQAQFNTFVSSGTLLNNYAHVFDLLMRLRQAVDHPYLVIYSKTNPTLQAPLGVGSARPLVEEEPLITYSTALEADAQSTASDHVPDCGICHESGEDVVQAACSHKFCRICVEEFLSSLPAEGEALCPVCAKPLTVDLTKSQEPEDANRGMRDHCSSSTLSPPRSSSLKAPASLLAKKLLSGVHKTSILHRIDDLASFQSSTKVEALLQELQRMKQRDPSGKAIVFSQFVNMLDIVQHRLALAGIRTVKLSGSMSMEARDKMLRAFRNDSSITAFLISLKAGGVALNLTVASHIFLMDPWWNPAAENQAIDRTHRLGQFKPIKATRFIIAGTIEERILKLQEKKKLVFEGTVGGDTAALCRLTEEDLRFLFSS